VKKTTCRVFSYKTAIDNDEYRVAAKHPDCFFYAVTNGAITFYSSKFADENKAIAALRSHMLARKGLRLSMSAG